MAAAKSQAHDPLAMRNLMLPVVTLLPAIGGSTTITQTVTEPEPLYAASGLHDEAQRLVAEVYINGVGPLRFLLDTGANQSAITLAAAARLGLEPDSNEKLLVNGVNGEAVVPVIRIGTLSAGALRLSDLRLPVIASAAFPGLDGILGADGFDRLRVTADFDSHRVTIGRSTGLSAGNRYKVLRGEVLSTRLFMVDARIGRIKVKAIVDTGASHSLGNQALLDQLSRQSAVAGHTGKARIDDATNTTREGIIRKVRQIDLRGAMINNAGIAFGEFAIFSTWGLEHQPAMLLGMDLLGTLDEMTIDYRRQELQLVTRDAPLVRRL